MDTNPALVAAAENALASVEFTEKSFSKETEFDHDGKRYWAKVTFDFVANTVDTFWVLSIDDPLVHRI